MLSERRRTNVRVKRGQFAAAAREIASVFRLIRERAHTRERAADSSFAGTVFERLFRILENFQVKNNSPLDTMSRRPIPPVRLNSIREDQMHGAYT